MDAIAVSEKVKGLISSKYVAAVGGDYDIAFTTAEIVSLLEGSFPSGCITQDLVYNVMESMQFELHIPPTEFAFKWLMKAKHNSVL